MSFIVGEEKTSLADLEHHGVLGMKWGKHRLQANAAAIRTARTKTNHANNKAWVAQKNAQALSKGSPARAKKQKIADQLHEKWQKSPDRVIAARMTRGEKVATTLLLGPIGLLVIGGSSAVSRRIEKKQDDKVYDKKK